MLALFLVSLSLYFYSESERKQRALVARQKQTLAQKQGLGQIERSLSHARQEEILVMKSKALVRHELAEDLSRILADSRSLSSATEPGLAEHLAQLDKVMQRYRQSVEETIKLVEKLEGNATEGSLVLMRRREDAISEHLTQLRDMELLQSFTRILVREREFTQSLDMRLAEELEQLCEELRQKVARKSIRSQLGLDLNRELNEYRASIGDFVEDYVALELQMAQSTLQFERIRPGLMEIQGLLDAQIEADTEAVAQLRRSVFLKSVMVFGLSLVGLGTLLILAFRRRRRLHAHLSELHAQLEAVAQGQFKEEYLSQRGEGVVGDLAEHFLTLARQIQNQVHTIEWERELAEQANLTKDRFLANMSHEIRTPMNGVLGIIELFDATQLDETQREYLRLLRSSSQSLLLIINDILDFSKIETGMLELDLRPFDVRTLFKDCVIQFSQRSQEKGLALNFHIAGQIPAGLVGDDFRLRQILVHLLSNAVKFTEEGRIRAEISLLNEQGNLVDLEFRVSDTGIGIPESIQEKIFQPFVQAKAGLNRKFVGTGLGLPICRMLVERMGGKLTLTSAEGKGTQIVFRLPFEVAAQNEPEVQPSMSSDTSISEHLMPGLKILVAEDNPVNQKVVLKMLFQLGYSADLATDGREALEMAEKHDYDFVFMDVQMPHMDGLAATEAILQARRHDPPVIIALTANVFDKDRETCLRAGMHDFVPKPFTQAKIREVLLRWTSNQEHPAD